MHEENPELVMVPGHLDPVTQYGAGDVDPLDWQYRMLPVQHCDPTISLPVDAHEDADAHFEE